ncbi:hypothetical protein KFK09_000074 [Dendrobium nobile]|uniref:Uncharacterized protein n=1 Tax=Dendrobium nobile TaxID=94219 RepID=A0A8T3CDN6_DENNO|nr:hypothetical protein KFK09_000074 [Dendrobium nobile]
MQALQLKTIPNANPYKVSWVKKGVEIAVTDSRRVHFSIRKNYDSEVMCDVIDMDVCHIILGRPWQFDVGAIHDCRANTYTFKWKGKTLKMLPSNRDMENVGQNSKPSMCVVSGNQLLHAWRDSSHILALVVKEKTATVEQGDVPELVKNLIEQYADLGPANLLAELLPLRNIQHRIDLIPGSTIPNLPHYRLCPTEQRIL